MDNNFNGSIGSTSIGGRQDVSFGTYNPNAAKTNNNFVATQYSDLQMQLEKLEAGIRELSNRLDQVLTPMPPTVGVNGTLAEPRQATSPMANSLFLDTQKVKEMQSLVGGILNRLEV